jgi:predicted MFS family arabinose efflux permease
MIGFAATNLMSYKVIFFFVATLIIIDGILIAFMPFPPRNKITKAEEVALTDVDAHQSKKEKMRFSPTSIALICLGFTATSTFQLWLNCNQELGILYGLAEPRQIQTFYSMGVITAILVTSFLVKKFVKPIRILVIYPIIAASMLLIIYLVQEPIIVLIGGFVMGYSAAGGVLQLIVSTANKMFPTNRGKITSIVMIASSLSNYVVLNIAGMITKAGGINGSRYILLFNIAITLVGILLALFVNIQYNKEQVGEIRGMEV